MDGSQNDSRLPAGFYRGSMKVSPSDELPTMAVPGGLPAKKEFAERVLTACKTIRALPDRERRFQGDRPLGNSIWREALDEWGKFAAEGYLASEALPFKFKPSRAEVDDCLVVLAWCAKLEKKDFRIIWARSFGWGFSKIADSMRLLGNTKHSHDTARARYLSAIDKVYGFALPELVNLCKIARFRVNLVA